MDSELSSIIKLNNILDFPFYLQIKWTRSCSVYFRVKYFHIQSKQIKTSWILPLVKISNKIIKRNYSIVLLIGTKKQLEWKCTWRYVQVLFVDYKIYIGDLSLYFHPHVRKGFFYILDRWGHPIKDIRKKLINFWNFFFKLWNHQTCILWRPKWFDILRCIYSLGQDLTWYISN